MASGVYKSLEEKLTVASETALAFLMRLQSVKSFLNFEGKNMKMFWS